jgi:hypothetical protein
LSLIILAAGFEGLEILSEVFGGFAHSATGPSFELAWIEAVA